MFRIVLTGDVCIQNTSVPVRFSEAIIIRLVLVSKNRSHGPMANAVNCGSSLGRDAV